jgi:hypothetical protein
MVVFTPDEKSLVYAATASIERLDLTQFEDGTPPGEAGLQQVLRDYHLSMQGQTVVPLDD